jgi:hypothetical protein
MQRLRSNNKQLAQWGLRVKEQVNLETNVRVAVLHWPGLRQSSSCSWRVRYNGDQQCKWPSNGASLLKAFW